MRNWQVILTSTQYLQVTGGKADMNKLVEMGICVQVSEQGLNGSEGTAAWHNIFIDSGTIF
ncbi:MAG: hypothetical protein MJK13_01240 [Pseudomonadales bacterium]|nr:hypothetical protein [Pseudomonadales bacterium]